MDISGRPLAGGFGDVLFVHHAQRIGAMQLEYVSAGFDIKPKGK